LGVPTRGSGPLVTFLGTGTPLGLQGLHQSCILIETRDQRLLLDCGMTALTSLGRRGLDPSQIDAIVISHLHGDHFGGVPLLLLDASLRGRPMPLTIAGPADTRRRVQQSLEVHGWRSAFMMEAATFVELVPGVSRRLAGCDVTAFEVPHNLATAPTGIRLVTDGAVIGYSGDAGWSDALVDIAHEADLFICGVWSFDTPDPTFIDLQTLLAQYGRLGCKRIILTHLGPTLLARRDAVPFEVATDGLVVQL
jgi:ribonuclease BN (tRNA processing enzyme)